MRLNPPQRVRLRLAGFVRPWMQNLAMALRAALAGACTPLSRPNTLLDLEIERRMKKGELDEISGLAEIAIWSAPTPPLYTPPMQHRFIRCKNFYTCALKAGRCGNVDRCSGEMQHRRTSINAAVRTRVSVGKSRVSLAISPAVPLSSIQICLHTVLEDVSRILATGKVAEAARTAALVRPTEGRRTRAG